LRCNVNACGTYLTDVAVVTICSHCICPQCAITAGFRDDAPLTCPACQNPLRRDDVFEQIVNPPGEWQNLAMCGLEPTIIMEAAGRAISFWSYQMGSQL
ncbi:hypothetical protein QBC42DRAFT_155167, partial [Cladorrhinum samala]